MGLKTLLRLRQTGTSIFLLLSLSPVILRLFVYKNTYIPVDVQVPPMNTAKDLEITLK